MKELITPIKPEDLLDLKIGETVYITGTIYTARDAAHKRLCELLKEGKPLPFNVKGQAIYYVGPTPAKPGQALGSCGPTSSYRMDAYSPQLMDQGLLVMIGKGDRSQAYKDALVKNKGVYLSSVGGAAALLSECVKEAKVIAYEDLGAEAIRELKVVKFPTIVTYDCNGNDAMAEGMAKYKRIDF